jgi:hypothetical protein
MPEQTLNQSVSWEALPLDARSAFVGDAEKVLLEEGFALYKLTEFDLQNDVGKVTEWWSPVHAYEMDAGLESRRGVANVLQVPFGDLVRVTYAVREDWNALKYLLTAVLSKDVYGFYGQCSLQPRHSPGKNPRPDVFPGKTMNLPGLGWQFYIPNLTPAHIQKLERTSV